MENQKPPQKPPKDSPQAKVVAQNVQKLQGFQKEQKKSEPKRAFSISLVSFSKERDYFLENFTMLMSAGMGVIQALEALKVEARSSRMRKTIGAIKVEIDNGSPIWKAMGKTKLLPPDVLSLIQIGEESGKLAENLKVIVNQQQKERVFRSKIRSAMIYPIIVLVMTLVIGIGIAWFILPRLTSVFAQLSLTPPLITRVLIKLGNYLAVHGMVVVPIFVVALILLVYFVFFFPKTKVIGETLLINAPGIRSLVTEIELSRFGYILGNLLSAGLPVLKALDSLTKATAFHAYKKVYQQLYRDVEEGISFQKSFARRARMARYIPTHVQQMVVAGEQSGHLAETLSKIGQIFEEKTDITTKNLAVLMEPILLIIVWLGVLGVALAVIMPIYSLIGNLNKY